MVEGTGIWFFPLNRFVWPNMGLIIPYGGGEGLLTVLDQKVPTMGSH